MFVWALPSRVSACMWCAGARPVPQNEPLLYFHRFLGETPKKASAEGTGGLWLTVVELFKGR
jgi:hypothetical protein